MWNQVRLSLARIEGRNASSDERMERMEEKVEHLDEAIRGNGKPGLRASHMSLEERVSSHSRAIRWFLGTVSTIATGIAIWLMTS